MTQIIKQRTPAFHTCQNVGTIKIGPVRSPREPAAMKRALIPPETVTYILANVNPLA